MSRRRIFWGLLIILVGFVLLINQFFPNLNLATFIWPGILIFVGVWLLLRPKTKSEPKTVIDYTVPLEGESEAHITLEHGAGRVHLDSMVDTDNLLSGTFAGGLVDKVTRSGQTAQIKLKPPSDDVWDVFDSQGFHWDIELNRDLTYRIVYNGGANEAELDLLDLKVADLKVESGASSVKIFLPENAGFTRVDVGVGVASVVIDVPDNVAAHIEKEGGLTSFNIDESQFPRSGNIYESPDYETAENKVDIKVSAGVGSIEIR